MAKHVSIRPAPEVETIAQELIHEHYLHLVKANILYLKTDAKSKCAPKVLGPLERFLSSGEAEEVEDGWDILIVVNMLEWSVLDDARHRALVDHLLSHIERFQDDGGDVVWSIARHTIEEFPDVIRRNGLWHAGLEMAAEAIQQLRLPMPAAGQVSPERTVTASAAADLVRTARAIGIESMTLRTGRDDESIGEPVAIRGRARS